MPYTRGLGKVPPFLRITSLSAANGSASAVTVANIVSGGIVDGEGAEPETFEEFAAGTKPLAISLEAKWTPEKNGLYFLAWRNARRECPFVFQRHTGGNGVGTSDNPSIGGVLQFPAKSGWEWEASDNGSDNFSLELQIVSIDADWNFGV